MPQISIIVPVYKVEKYLNACLDSILAQTFKDFEIICINDGSPDKCGEILKYYTRQDKRIKIITQKNQGVSAARNNGLKKATGQYICFVDSDDEIAPRFLETLYFQSETNRADIASCDFTQSKTHFNWNDYPEKNIQVWDNIFENYIRKKLKISASIWGKLFKKETIKDLTFNKDIAIGEDLVYLYQCLNQAHKLVIIPQKLYFYRIRENSAINSEFSKKMIDGNVATAIELNNYFKNKKLSSTALKLLEQKITKRLFKFCVLEPRRKDKKNTKKWYEYTKPLLKNLTEQKIYQPRYLDLKNRIKSWLFLRGN